jgi:hypothetical protein
MKKLIFVLCFVFLTPLFAQELRLGPGESPALIGGTIADRKLYPATVWIGNCTASIIGPRTIWTAAHCVRTSASTTIGTARYTSRCIRDENYLRGNSTADYALCFTDREVAGIPYENVNIDPKHVSKGDYILQSGFGCTRWGGAIDGQLRVGRSQILTMPSGTNNDYVTGNGAVLCSGDSGGPAWSLNPDGSRNLLISTNSWSNTTSRSYLSAIATSQGLAFLKRYQDQFKTGICGVDQKVGCRGVKPAEPVEFMIENAIAKLVAIVQPTAPYSVEDATFSMQAVMDSIEERDSVTADEMQSAITAAVKVLERGEK